MSRPYGVLLVDDEELLRGSLRMLVDSDPQLEAVGEASTGVEALEQVRARRPDVVLMDVRMPEMDGLEATRRVCGAEELKDVKIVILTTFDLDEYVYTALEIGASGFLLKNSSPQDLLRAIHVVAQGDALLAPEVTRRLIESYGSWGKPDRQAGQVAESLTEREREVLVLVAEGCSNTQIADRLFLSPATVKTYMSRMLQRLHARDRAQLVIIAYESGLVVPGRGPGD